MDWIKQKLNRQVLVSIVLGMSILGGILVVAGNYIVSEALYYRDQIHHAFTMNQEATKLQLGFKTQVQEWKNVLLRGKSEKDRTKYWGKFLKQENDNKGSISKLKELDHDHVLDEILSKFGKSLTSLGSEYRKGYDIYTGTGYNSAKADAYVRGIDREPAEYISKINGILLAEMEKLEHAETGAMYQAEIISFLVVLIFITLFCVLFYKGSMTLIVDPLTKLSALVEKYGRGENVEFVSSRKDEIGKLFSSLLDMKVKKKNRKKKVHISPKTINASKKR